ncbi:short chain dehydrogenase family protein [Verticillium dahliae VdLs.17]|uniref:Short chain dehydrogenase family protein n=1 Tax=Verticillium dahliae (strain VdLs.17 / ATCC MYA-4575 / FGSC 10137) TaxID=498257 RepID=G2X7T4_VERDV|nr:short chain dehydrogenase family protein [Verticillium dahliae VdLs.17]EGY15052.1 short chain dehydrogenase family protein [Verticillium dahliae VdLs.17]
MSSSVPTGQEPLLPSSPHLAPTLILRIETLTMTSKPVAIVVGASRGIGRQIAIDLAKDGYAVVVAAKTTSDASTASPFPPNPNSPASTINTVEREIRQAGHEATAIAVDVRDPASIQRLVDRALETYGALSLLVYNSGAAWWAPVASSPFKRFRLLQQVNPEGLYASVQSALPHLTRTAGRIVVVSPPIYSRFFRGKTAYAMGKVGMSVLTKGLAMDFVREGRGMAITSLWPAVVSSTRIMSFFSFFFPFFPFFFPFPPLFSFFSSLVGGTLLTGGTGHRVGGHGKVYRGGSRGGQGPAQGDHLLGRRARHSQGPR